jgi:proteasome lid subunit RPN8/RPN11
MFSDCPNEQCWVLLGQEDRQLWWAYLRNRTEGAPTSVRSDASWVLAREETTGDVIGFCHTHPHWPATPSGTDTATMRAWVLAFGKPLVCVIFGTDGNKGWWFEDDESEPIECQVSFVRGVILIGTTELEEDE